MLRGQVIELESRPDRAELRRRDDDIETHCSICVVPDADAELRVITVINHGHRRRDLELTSYAAVCLNARRADQAHPAFAKLFLETEFDAHSGALLAQRRPREAKKRPIWAIHCCASSASVDRAIEYETDRARFLGRGRTPANPAALDAGSRLSRTTGPVLDPVFSLRRRMALEAGATARIAFVTGAADTRESAVATAKRFLDLEAIDEAFAAATTFAASELRALDLTPDDTVLFNHSATSEIYTGNDLRDPGAMARTARPTEPVAVRNSGTCRSCWLDHWTDDEAIVHRLVGGAAGWYGGGEARHRHPR